MSDEPKKQPEETADVPLPESELEKATGGVTISKVVDVSSPKFYEGVSQPTPPAK